MLILKTDRDSLLRPLQAVTGIVERRHTLPILSNVLLNRTANSLEFVATDLEIEISTSMECDAQGESLAVTVGARKLHDILRSLPEGAQVSLDAQDSRLLLKAGSSRFNLQTLSAAEFPRMAASSGAGLGLKLQQGNLRRTIALVQYAMAQQDVRYYLNGLLLLLESDRLRTVATDGHRLAYAELGVGTGQEGREAILPRKTVVELAKLLGDGDEELSLDLTEGQARFSFSGITLISKVIDGKFPDFNRVIPTQHDKIFTVERLALQQALQRAAILSNEKFRGVRIGLLSKALRVACTNNEQEDAEEELAIDYDQGALDIGFNVSYILDVLNNVDAATIQCAFRDANSSALFTLPGRDDFKYVVMPMRI